MAVLPRDRVIGWNRDDRMVIATLAMPLTVAVLFVACRDSGPADFDHVPALKIDPNRDPIGVIEALPQIGPVIGDAIVAAREQAPFARVEDLDIRVRGIGPVRRELIRPHLTFDDVPTHPASND